MFLSEWTKTLHEKQDLDNQVDLLNLRLETLSFNNSTVKIKTDSITGVKKIIPVIENPVLIKTISELTNEVDPSNIDINPTVGNTYNTYNYYGESRTYNRYGQLNTKI
jgi:hypothetical protein